jgi:hypothetical protein
MSEDAGVRCDGCGARAPTPAGVYPAGWLRLHAWGRRRGSTSNSKLGTIDACPEPGCAQEALSNLYIVTYDGP